MAAGYHGAPSFWKFRSVAGHPSLCQIRPPSDSRRFPASFARPVVSLGPPMLELIQQRFQTVVLVLLIFMLAGVFAIQFGGPQAEGCTSSLNQTGFAARV